VTTYRTSETPTEVILTPQGDIVSILPGGLRERLHELIENDTRNIVIDIAASTYIDSLSLAVLVDCKNKLAEKGRTIRLLNPNDDIATIISVASLDVLL